MQDKTLGPRQVKKIWVAMSTPFQANFFAPLIKELEGEYQFLVTARDHDGIQSILKSKGIDYVSAGKHGGKRLAPDGKMARGRPRRLRDEHPILDHLL
jgi:predicted glycosyltransferase